LKTYLLETGFRGIIGVQNKKGGTEMDQILEEGEVDWGGFRVNFLYKAENFGVETGKTWMALVSSVGSIMERFALLGNIEDNVAFALKESPQDATINAESILRDVLDLVEYSGVLVLVFKEKLDEVGIQPSFLINPKTKRIFHTPN
jgi:hypothetical protein